MTTTPTEPDEHRVAAEARAWYVDFFARRTGPRGRDVAEDLAQEATVGLLRALRTAPARSIDALRIVIGRRAWFGFLRREYRWRKLLAANSVDELAEVTADRSRPEDPLAVGDPAERLRFQVLEYFGARHAKCTKLAALFFSGLDWIEVGRRVGMGYGAVRQQWSRCLAALRTAVARDNDLRASLWAFWQDDHA